MEHRKWVQKKRTRNLALKGRQRTHGTYANANVIEAEALYSAVPTSCSVYIWVVMRHLDRHVPEHSRFRIEYMLTYTITH